MISAAAACWIAETSRWLPTGVGHLSVRAAGCGIRASKKKARAVSLKASADRKLVAVRRDALVKTNLTPSAKPQSP